MPTVRSGDSTRELILAALAGVLAILNVVQFLDVFGVRPETPVIADGGSLSGVQSSPREIVDRFHQLYYRTPNTWATNRWLGVQTYQNPNDVWIMQEILHRVAPDVVVETGSAKGGSALLWATLLEQINAAAQVVTIDIEDDLDEARKHPLFERRIEFLHGSSTAPETVSEVARLAAGKKVLVVLDSDHSAAHVAAELRAYAPLVSPGSYLVVQDTNVNGHPVWPDFGPGPMEAVEEFLAATDEFESDDSFERRFLFTFCPRGYLKRVRAPRAG